MAEVPNQAELERTRTNMDAINEASETSDPDALIYAHNGRQLRPMILVEAAGITNVTAAQAAENAAKGYRDQAADYAGAAQAYGNINASIALGRPTVADGQYFKVIPGGVDNLPRLSLYLRLTSSTQALIDSFVSGAEFDAFINAAAWEAAGRLTFVDGSNNRLMQLSDSTITHPHIKAIDAKAARNTLTARMSRQLVAQGSVIHRIKSAINHWLWYGQSLSVGSSAGHVPQPLPGAQAKMFNGGIFTRSGYDPADTGAITGSRRTSLVPMKETARETGTLAAFKMFQQLLLEENGIDIAASGQQILGSSAGVGGVNIQTLAGTYFFRVTEDIHDARLLADAASKSYGLGALFYVGNESNQSTATVSSFLAALRAMRAQVEAAGLAETGIADVLPMITYQTNTHLSTASANYYNVNAQVAQAQLAASLDEDNVDPNICMAGPAYFLRFTDGVHPDGVSYDWMNAYGGLVAKRWFVDGVKPRPLSPVSARLRGNYIRLTFAPPPGYQLQWDTTLVPAQTNYGFDVTDSTGTPKTVSAVSLVGPNEVEIALTGGAPVVGDFVRYAFATNVVGGTVGMGNLRDNQGDTIIYDPNGINKPMHNWAPLFRIGVTA